MPRNLDKKQCDGRSKRSGKRCKKDAVPGATKCHIHGGKSTGPEEPARPIGNQRAVTHGIYINHLTAEELEAQKSYEAERGRLDCEADLARTIVNRILALMAKESKGDQNAGLVLSEIKQELGSAGEKKDGQDKKNKGKTVTVTRKKPELFALLDRWVARVESIEKRRAELKMEELTRLTEQMQKALERINRVAGDSKPGA